MAVEQADDFLGQGPAYPFRVGPRGAPDFAMARGAPAVDSAVEFLMMTGRGDLPFEPALGLDFRRYKHKANDEDTRDEAIMDIRQSLIDAEPRVVNVRPEIEQLSEEKQFRPTVRFGVITQQVPGNRVLLPSPDQANIHNAPADVFVPGIGVLDSVLLQFGDE